MAKTIRNVPYSSNKNKKTEKKPNRNRYNRASENLKVMRMLASCNC